MKIFKSLILLALVSVLGLQAANAESVKTENRNVSGFHAVDVSAGIDLYLKMGDTEEVKVVADGDIIDKLVTEVKDGTLRIYMKRTTWNWGFNKTQKVYVTVKELTKIGASAGSDVRSENTLKGESLSVNVSSGSDVNLDIVYKNFKVNTSSGSDAKISGKTKHLVAEASSGSDINAENLESVTCKANASSGSDITVRVNEELHANASSGADISYYGNPAVRDTDESSGGDVRRR